MVQQQTHEPSAWSAAAQWLLGKTRDNLTSDKLQGEKGLGWRGRAGPLGAAHLLLRPRALLSLSCVVTSKTWKCHRAQGAQPPPQRATGDYKVRERHWFWWVGQEANS